MDDAFGMVVLVCILILVICGCAFLVAGSMDKHVVAACKERGYWQTGQTRVICSVEGEKK